MLCLFVNLLFEKMSENDPNDQRRPRNMQGLLNFCTELTVREDTTQPSDLSHMDPERRRFLEEALSQLTTNVARKLAESIQCLCSEAVTMPGEDISEQEAALETIEEYVDDLNYAVDLHKMGGYPVLVSCLESPHASLRAGAASLIGDICQNMEYCQTHMMELSILPKLIHMLEYDEIDKCKIKALYAISCLIRDFPDGEKEFERNDGFSVLMRAMQTGVEKLIVKSVFLLTSLIREYDSGKDTVISMGYIEQLLGILNCDSTDNITKEHCSSALLHLASSYQPALSECNRPELQMRTTLAARAEVIATMDESKEEHEHITELLKLLNTNEDEDDNR